MTRSCSHLADWQNYRGVNQLRLRCGGSGNSDTPLTGVQTGTTAREGDLAVFAKTENPASRGSTSMGKFMATLPMVKKWKCQNVPQQEVGQNVVPTYNGIPLSRRRE